MKTACVGKVNKEGVRKELYARCGKVWSSELSAYNQATAHKIFVISIITPTFAIIDWAIEELKEIGKRTRKISENVWTAVFIRIAIWIDSITTIPRWNHLYNHLQVRKNRSEYVNYVYQQEESQSVKVGQELKNKNNIVTAPIDTPKQAGKKLLRRFQEEESNSYKRKMMHRYFRKTIELGQNIDKKESQQWLQDKHLTCM